ncbi:amidohydrolase family protein [Flavitalea flava]
MTFNRILLPLSLVILITGQYCTEKPKSSATAETYYTLSDFDKVEKFDVHVHVNTYKPFFITGSQKDNFKLVDLNVNAPDYPPLEQQRQYTTKHLHSFPERFSWSTSFTINRWDSADWQSQTLSYLKESFDSGAIGVKVWKNIGMEFKDKKGRFIMIDDPRLDTVFSFIEQQHKTLTGHLGEPKDCWLPLKDMIVKNDRDYYTGHPEFHMFLHPEFPSYEDQIRARDHMLEKHPGLRFVGAHLGSLEWNVDELAKRLDKFPNMAVDMAERISHLQYQTARDHKKVYDFFIKYQDRLLYATDFMVDDSMDSSVIMNTVHATRFSDWKFFTSEETMEVPLVEGKFQALHLPREVVDKIYRKNAEKWYPGSATLSSEKEENSLVIRKTGDFALSGAGSDDHWKKTDWVTIPNRSPSGDPYSTKVKLLYSDSGLYCLYTCEDKKITATFQKDFQDLWKEDVIEVFLQPDERRPAYLEYELSPLDHELPIFIYNANGKLNSWIPFHYEEGRKTRHTITLLGNSGGKPVRDWTASFFIPFELLQPLMNPVVSPPKPGTRWKGNLYRIDYDKGENLWSWNLNSGNFHEYDKFGTFIFE